MLLIMLKKMEFQGLAANSALKVRNYHLTGTGKSKSVSVFYQAKRELQNYRDVLLVNCFNENGEPIESARQRIEIDLLYATEVVKLKIDVAAATRSCSLHFVKP